MSNQPDIHLYTASTMNGWKPLIFLEEAGIPFALTAIDFSRKEQKSEAYLALNPNGRIPTLVDRGNDNFVVFESGAILWYLAEKYGVFLPTDAKQRSETLQWLMFQMGGIGPMMGQAMYFQRIAQPQGQDEPFAVARHPRRRLGKGPPTTMLQLNDQCSLTYRKTHGVPPGTGDAVCFTNRVAEKDEFHIEYLERFIM